MKKHLLSLLFVGALFATGTRPVSPLDMPPPSPAATQPGRYAIVAAGAQTFRLDTATGQAWTYEETTISGVDCAGWHNVAESWDYSVAFWCQATTSNAPQATVNR